MGPGQLIFFEKMLKSSENSRKNSFFRGIAQKCLYVPMVFDQPMRKFVFLFTGEAGFSSGPVRSSPVQSSPVQSAGPWMALAANFSGGGGIF